MADKFPDKVRKILCDQAGNMCCKCKRPTSKANAEGDGAVRTGIAAHITAASPGGARYNSKMAPSERSSAENGIWLCTTCAKEIDDDDDYFTPEELHAMKKKAETAN
jgi:hypothetical protein